MTNDRTTDSVPLFPGRTSEASERPASENPRSLFTQAISWPIDWPNDSDLEQERAILAQSEPGGKARPVSRGCLAALFSLTLVASPLIAQSRVAAEESAQQPDERGTERGDERSDEQKQREEAAEQELQLMKLASNRQVAFLHHDPLFSRGVPRGAGLVFQVSEDLPLFRASLAEAFARANNVNLLAEIPPPASSEAQGNPFEALAQLMGAAQSDPSGERLARTGSDQVLELPDAPRDWPPSESLIQLTLFSSPDAATVGALTGGELNAESPGQCLEVETISAATGLLSDVQLVCIRRDRPFAEFMPELKRALGATCRGAPYSVLLPLAMQDSSRHWLPDDHPLSKMALKTLSSAGCRIQDIPSRTSGTKPLVFGSSPETARAGWRYHSRLLSRVRPAPLDSWRDGDVAVTIKHVWRTTSSGQLVEKLKEFQEESTIDPDLMLPGRPADLRYHRLEVEAVHMGTGELLAVGSIDAGPDLPNNVLADAVVDLVLDRPSHGWLEVHRIPTDSRLRVDGNARAATLGTEVFPLKPGTHKLDLLIGRRSEASTRVSTPGGTFGVSTLAVPFGWLKVISEPEGASVRVDDSNWGPAPVERSLSSGAHTVVASLEACGTTQEKATVRIGEKGALTVHLPGSVEAEVFPSEAEIYLDGAPIGAGSARVSASYGRHTLEYRLKGFETRKEEIDVQACQPTASSHTFYGRLKVASTPAPVEVRIDGTANGNAPSESFLPQGKHSVRCLACEYGGASREVELAPGRLTELSLPLEPPRISFTLGPEVRVGFGSSGMSGIGARAGLWFGSRFGAIGHFGIAGVDGDSRPRVNLLASLRLRPLGPRWNMPLSAGLDWVNLEGEENDLIGPTARLEFRACISGGFVIGFGAGVSLLGPDWTPVLNAMGTISWQSAVKW